MTSLSRMLAVLELFDEGASVWTADAIAQRLGYSLPTGYRYVRELTEAGLLRRDAGGTYVLGPRVIELDHRIRIGDPLLIAGQRVMRDLADQTGCDVVLGTIYGERIITIHHEHGDEGFAASYGRGRRMPLFRGMLSKAILSALPRAALRRLHAHHIEEAESEAMSRDWDTLVANLKAIRAAGYSTSHGELDPGGSGIAVPLASPPRRLVAALGFVMSQRRFRTSDEEALVAMLGSAAARIVAALPPVADEPDTATAAPKRRGRGIRSAA